MPPLFRAKVARVSDEPERPSFFEVDQNVRIPGDQDPMDYVGLDDAPEPEETAPRQAFTTEAIPTYQVQAPPGDPAIRRWAGDNYTLAPGAAPVRIAGQDRKRTRLLVANQDSANSLYLTTAEYGGNAASRAGAMVRPWGEVEIGATDAVYAYTAAGSPVVVSVLTEYSLDR